MPDTKEIQYLPIEKLKEFEGHPFKVIDNEEMTELVKSIRKQGVISPVVVRPKDDNYEIISGHRRLYACKLAGVTEVPVIVRELDKTQAIIAVVDSNLHREHILPSEKAFAYKMKMEAMQKQGQRNDLTLSQPATKLDTATEIGRATNESRDQVFRYIRLTNLVPELLALVDNNKIALTPAVELSYLTQDEQYNLLDSIDRYDCTPSHAQAIKMKKLSQQSKLTEDDIDNILSEEKPNQKEKVVFKYDDLSKYFPWYYSPTQVHDSIIRMLQRKQLQKKKVEREER